MEMDQQKKQARALLDKIAAYREGEAPDGSTIADAALDYANDLLVDAERLAWAISYVPPTEDQADVLIAFESLLYKCNQVDEHGWSHQAEGRPYNYAYEGLRAALADLYGVDCARQIVSVMHESGEPILSSIESYFGLRD